ncbi:glycosyl transferase family 17 protein [Apiospora saccharicola]|uniref:Glycosyl transferase family 17 protein n=1 Tax=Apiospora saccharicola TaxID=335842 RepID=A0ABR1WF09_9PEZI
MRGPRCFGLDRRSAPRLIAGLIFSFLLLTWLNSAWTDRTVHRVNRFDPHPQAGDVGGLCKQHGWAPFRPRGLPTRPRKVYDLLMVNTELEWLEIRLNTTYEFVDYFVVVESPKTFTNHDKPLVIKNNLDRFAAYRDKIIYHTLDIPPGFHSDRANPAWDWEDLQRNAMYDQVLPQLQGPQAPEEGDAIVVADVDEIIRPQTLVLLKSCNFPRRLNLRSHFYYYSFQFMHRGVQWSHPQATYYQGRRTILPVNLRNGDGNLPPLVKLETADLWDAGWHCSSCFSTMEELLTKMSSFSHQWMNHEHYRRKEWIAEHIREGRDIWERPGQEYDKIVNNQDVPNILLDQGEIFGYLMNRDGPSAGFTDYP